MSHSAGSDESPLGTTSLPPRWAYNSSTFARHSPFFIVHSQRKRVPRGVVVRGSTADDSGDTLALATGSTTELKEAKETPAELKEVELKEVGPEETPAELNKEVGPTELKEVVDGAPDCRLSSADSGSSCSTFSSSTATRTESRSKDSKLTACAFFSPWKGAVIDEHFAKSWSWGTVDSVRVPPPASGSMFT